MDADSDFTSQIRKFKYVRGRIIFTYSILVSVLFYPVSLSMLRNKSKILNQGNAGGRSNMDCLSWKNRVYQKNFTPTSCKD